MGFNAKQAEIALSKTNNDVERAIDFLFNHPEELIEEEKVDEGKRLNSSHRTISYSLFFF